MSWIDLAKARFIDGYSHETPKNPIPGFMGVPTPGVPETAGGFSGFLGAGTPGLSEITQGFSSVGGGALSRIAAANESRAEAALLADLLTAAMRACDHHGDGLAAREQMRADCLATPHHLRADLLKHFRTSYPHTSEGTDHDPR